MGQMVQGVVIRGLGQGRALGFPTANLKLPKTADTPPEGIWAAWAQLDHKQIWHKAAAHIGPRPTIAGATHSIELHLLNFPDQDLYGCSMNFTLQERLRDIKKFATLKELRAAIQADCQQVEQLLTSPPLMP